MSSPAALDGDSAWCSSLFLPWHGRCFSWQQSLCASMRNTQGVLLGPGFSVMALFTARCLCGPWPLPLQALFFLLFLLVSLTCAAILVFVQNARVYWCYPLPCSRGCAWLFCQAADPGMGQRAGDGASGLGNWAGRLGEGEFTKDNLSRLAQDSLCGL